MDNGVVLIVVKSLMCSGYRYFYLLYAIWLLFFPVGLEDSIRGKVETCEIGMMGLLSAGLESIACNGL